MDRGLTAKLLRYCHTIKHLKVKQLTYQILNRLGLRNSNDIVSLAKPLGISLMDVGIESPESLRSDTHSFIFLNRKYAFTDSIDWNHSHFGKLWTYNLNYFDFLCNSALKKEVGISLIKDFISNYDSIIDGQEPYPTSLRIINWIKFISKYSISEKTIDDSLTKQVTNLANNLEYHLHGNHLLENAFSLLFAAYYFRDDYLNDLSSKVIKKELDEQVLNDGGHFELSPMYHRIILFRVLDCINLIQSNKWNSESIEQYLVNKAINMLGWMESLSYKGLNQPNFNDSIDGIAATPNELIDYAKSLKLKWIPNELTDSGYRLLRNDNFQLAIDVGNIGPDYIPGHAHADTFNFELAVNNIPVIVDTGISTYEKNHRRQLERSTSSHNTVVVNDHNSSDVWGGFRVGQRAKIIRLIEYENKIDAAHNGYRTFGITHNRLFAVNEKSIQITDILGIVNRKKYVNSFHTLHFHPNIEFEISSDSVIIETLGIRIYFENILSLRREEYFYCVGFNKTIPSNKVIIKFDAETKTIIEQL